jgi:hypothetical protein
MLSVRKGRNGRQPYYAGARPAEAVLSKVGTAGINLWTVPSHKSCNGEYKLDEEYFYHALYPLVGDARPPIAEAMLDDLRRRAEKPQTPALIRDILRTKRTTMEGGIVLPPGKVAIDVDKYRVQRVAIKIGRCLFYRDQQRVIPLETCRDIHLCQSEEEVPEIYRLSWGWSKVNVPDCVPVEPSGLLIADPESGKPAGACNAVFSYRTACVNGMHVYSLMFWQAFMFCMLFDESAHAEGSSADREREPQYTRAE